MLTILCFSRTHLYHAAVLESGGYKGLETEVLQETSARRPRGYGSLTYTTVCTTIVGNAVKLF